MINKAPVIGFIGAGNMSSSIIRGLINNGVLPETIIASNRSCEKLDLLVHELGVQKAPSNDAVVEASDIVILGIKPSQHQAVLRSLAKPLLRKRVLLVTVAIAVTVEMMERWIGLPYAIVRVMPNTPSQIAKGIVGLYANEQVSKTDLDLVTALFSSVGSCIHLLKETQINAIASLSGSGPAYVYFLMEAWALAASQAGFTEDEAKNLVLGTVEGALALVNATKKEPSVLRAEVTSPKGSTEAAIAVFQEHDMVGVFSRAMGASVARINALQKQLDE